jgi:MFS family permease
MRESFSGDREETASQPDRSPVSGYSYLVLIMLCMLYTLNFLDRQLLSVLAEPIKLELHLSDTQLGLLTGLTFAIFYTFFGIPLAWLADRTRRVPIIACACAIWSLFSVACGFATSFVTLALARVGVGIGEAGGSPPSYSLISDYFPPARRGLALAIYSLGVPFGMGLGAAVGGRMGAAYGWRAAFLAVGLPGLLIAALVLFAVREPKRGKFDAAPDASDAVLSLFASVSLFFRTPKLLLTALSASFTSFVGYALLNWTPAFLMREKGMTLAQIGAYYSLTLAITMGLGTWASGYIVDKLGPKRPAAYALVPGAATLISLPFLFGMVYAPNWQIALLMFAGPSLLNITYLAPGLAVIQNGVPPERRAVAGALFLFALNLIGLGGGPLFVGMVSDFAKASYGHGALTIGLLALTPFFLIAALFQAGSAFALSKDKKA